MSSAVISESPALLTVRQVAAMLGCSARHVYRLADRGAMPRPTKLGDVHTRRSVAHGRRIGRYVSADGNRARQYRDTLASAAARKRPTQRTLFDNEEG